MLISLLFPIRLKTGDINGRNSIYLIKVGLQLGNSGRNSNYFVQPIFFVCRKNEPWRDYYEKI
jgi:hypothetical protein